MEDQFTIYIDRLRGGGEEIISAEVPPSFMQIDEEELSFPSPIVVEGKAYLAEDHLVLHLDIATEAIMPCKMCNVLKALPVKIEGLYHTQPLDEIKESLFDAAVIVREAILLDIPSYYDCPDEECEGRKTAKKYLKQEARDDGETYHPFANLK